MDTFEWELFGRTGSKAEFLLPTRPHLGMDQLQQFRIDVYSEEQLDRYEQLFDLRMTHILFGMGEQRSFIFFGFPTLQDFCLLRVTCFAVAVELHDTLEDLALHNITWPCRGNETEGNETDAPLEMRHNQ
jgi:hypothetical protein